jgi:hypothetical protein
MRRRGDRRVERTGEADGGQEETDGGGRERHGDVGGNAKTGERRTALGRRRQVGDARRGRGGDGDVAQRLQHAPAHKHPEAGVEQHHRHAQHERGGAAEDHRAPPAAVRGQPGHGTTGHRRDAKRAEHQTHLPVGQAGGDQVGRQRRQQRIETDEEDQGGDKDSGALRHDSRNGCEGRGARGEMCGILAPRPSQLVLLPHHQPVTKVTGSKRAKSLIFSPVPTKRTGTPKFLLDVEHRAAFAGAIQLGQDQCP